MFEHVHPDDRDDVIRLSRIGIRRGEGKIEYRFLDSENKFKWVEDHFRTVYDSLGVAELIVGTWTDVTNRRITENALRASNEALEREQIEIEIMGDLNDHLYVCNTVDDTKKVIEYYLTKLFPDSNGAVFMFNQSRSMLEQIAMWGDNCRSQNFFNQEDCWALRQGKTHKVKNNHKDLCCSHINETQDHFSYYCLPLIAQSDVLGLVHLSTNTTSDNGITDEVVGKGINMQHAKNVSKQLSLSLMNLRLRESLKTQATRDPLTKLYNRRFMQEFLEKEMIRIERKKLTLSYMMLDVDNFKQFNDIYGHEAGDVVLVKLLLY